MEALEDMIYMLESSLLRLEVRRSAEMIAERLSNDFMEFCSSGTVYHYQKGDTFDAERTEELDWEIRDFGIKKLVPNVILATYKMIKHDETRPDRKYSLRCSVWKCHDGQWKMVFHQGTPGGDFE